MKIELDYHILWCSDMEQCYEMEQLKALEMQERHDLSPIPINDKLQGLFHAFNKAMRLP